VKWTVCGFGSLENEDSRWERSLLVSYHKRRFTYGRDEDEDAITELFPGLIGDSMYM
jgi:hypothetical protein